MFSYLDSISSSSKFFLFFLFVYLFCLDNTEVAKQLDKAKGIAEIIKEIKEADGCGAFHLAAAQGKTEICQYLVEDLNFVVDFHSVRGIPNFVIFLFFAFI